MEPGTSRQPPHTSAGQKYTTVGSVWQPQSLPMQPPTRRGRTLRSAIPEPFEYDYSAAATHHHPIQHYSPLQQNFDRAVSPLPSRARLTERIAEHERQGYLNPPIMPRVSDFPPFPNQPMAGAYGPVQQQTDATVYRSDDEGSEGGRVVGDDAEINIKLKEMSTKSLTNLASYPNPMQKAAQQILTRARQVPPSMQQQASDSMQDTRGLPPSYGLSLRNIHSDPAPMGSQLQSDRVDEYGLNRSFRALNMNTSEAAIRERDSYPAVLSRGPGAPLPLTAGPPGQRRYDPPTFNPMNTIQRESFTYNQTNAWQKEPSEFTYSTNPWGKNPQHSRGVEPYDDIPRTQPYPSFQPQRSMQPGSQQPPQLYMNEGFPSFQPGGMNKGKAKDYTSSSKIVDTLTYEEAKKFYPNGFPADFNHDTQPVPDNWAELRLKEVEEEEKRKNQMAFQQRPEFQAARKARLHRSFYSANDRINKDFNMAVHEQSSRNVARALGSTFEPERPAGRVVNRHLSVEEANEIPTHEHAKPLLSMLYQSMANYPEVTPSPYLPQRDDPAHPTQRSDSVKHGGSTKYDGSR
ncbi:hypothetical protein F4776DRAFT_332253 [Hypoxylon sp. NC0597]|nr:hypothetical protein F4776DRAFT_332253 [Hypoxylon sp. NC0597]